MSYLILLALVYAPEGMRDPESGTGICRSSVPPSQDKKVFCFPNREK